MTNQFNDVACTPMQNWAVWDGRKRKGRIAAWTGGKFCFLRMRRDRRLDSSPFVTVCVQKGKISAVLYRNNYVCFDRK